MAKRLQIFTGQLMDSMEKFNAFLRKHFRLIEAAGMATVLICWAFDWSSVQHWDSAKRGLKDSLQSAQYAYAESHKSASQRLDAAMTRAQNQSGVAILYDNKENLDKIYDSAWRSEEVRQRWHTLVADNVFAANNYLFIVKTFNYEHKLNLDKEIQESEEYINRTKKLLGEEFFKAPRGSIIVIPDKKQITPQIAGQYASISYKLVEQTVGLINDATRALENKSSFASSAYKIIFVIGTALLILAKFYEWRISLS